MQAMNRTYHAAVIGGGLTGLTASIYLAKAGLSVILLEKSEHVGGRAITVDKHKAYLNLGVHALYQNVSTDAEACCFAWARPCADSYDDRLAQRRHPHRGRRRSPSAAPIY